MTINNLKDVYFDQLQDLHSACNQSMEATADLGRAAKDKELSKALIAGVNGISEGLATEARAHGVKADISDHDARDAVIITQYQRMVHYALAGYGSVVAFANRLGLDEDAAKLQKLLDDTYDGDRHMTKIATGGVNKAAA
ncbi:MULTISPECIES: DUF892 family protein [Roseobacteraceae]|uniref:Uncharacterized protein n=1 Tax=Pseudosulfitobacter pseudonitzschiae TaxID=1402135 RepID=A0A221K346_9RHOB|nr:MULTISPECIES: DUF892 family protein [Roseobacteraceae]ASM73428.1 hypothetical protein SULPSESMR1_02633 [Pseudosulfitobacter pseudonitzschiae]